MPGKTVNVQNAAECNLLRRVSDLYLQGCNFFEIAAQTKIPPSQVVKYVDAMKQQWLEKCAQNYQDRKSMELARIELLERKAWEAWEESKKGTQKATERAEELLQEVVAGAKKESWKHKGTGGAKKLTLSKRVKTLEVTGSNGDPRFLQVVQWCIDIRCRIVGILAKDPPPDAKPKGEVFDWDTLYEPDPVTPDKFTDPADEAILALPPAKKDQPQ